MRLQWWSVVQQQSYGKHDTEAGTLYMGCSKQHQQQFLWIYLLELGWRIHGKLPKWSGRLLVWCGELKVVAEVLECANERHRNDFIKYITPWWFENNLLTRCVSCSVRSPVSRPSPKLASSRLRQRLLGAAASQTSRRKTCYRQSDLFSNSSWLYYFTHHVLQCSSSAHY